MKRRELIHVLSSDIGQSIENLIEAKVNRMQSSSGDFEAEKLQDARERVKKFLMTHEGSLFWESTEEAREHHSAKIVVSLESAAGAFEGLSNAIENTHRILSKTFNFGRPYMRSTVLTVAGIAVARVGLHATARLLGLSARAVRRHVTGARYISNGHAQMYWRIVRR